MSHKRRRSVSTRSASSGSVSSTSTTPDEERAKHYPMFEDAYLDHTAPYLRDSSRPESEQPFLQKEPSSQRYLLYGRYLFVRQLGKGTYSKVVLAKDLHAVQSVSSGRVLQSLSVSSLNTDFVAIKIFRGERCYDDAFRDECDILNVLSQPMLKSSGSASGCDAVPAMLEDALFDGAHAFSRSLSSLHHRVHCAIVFPALGMSLLELLACRKKYFEVEVANGRSPIPPSSSGPKPPPQPTRRGERYERFRRGGLPLFAVRSFGYQLFSFLHYCRTKGIVHTDLKPENILVEHKKTLNSEDLGPLPVTLGIKVIDFGSAEFVSNFSSISENGSRISCRTIQTRHYRAPEVIFGSGWSYPADMWSAGLILWEMLQGDCVFMTHEDREHLAMMERFIGSPSPKEGGYWSLFKHGDRFEDFVSRKHRSSGSLRWPHSDTYRKDLRYVDEIVPLAEDLRDFSDSHQFCTFVDLIQRVLDWNPSRRLSAAEALAHPFFTS